MVLIQQFNGFTRQLKKAHKMRTVKAISSSHLPFLHELPLDPEKHIEDKKRNAKSKKSIIIIITTTTTTTIIIALDLSLVKQSYAIILILDLKKQIQGIEYLNIARKASYLYFMV